MLIASGRQKENSNIKTPAASHLLAYAQMLSTSGRFFRAASTLPRETYSPAWSFTRSFLRSIDEEQNLMLVMQHRSLTLTFYFSEMYVYTSESKLTHVWSTFWKHLISDLQTSILLTYPSLKHEPHFDCTDFLPTNQHLLYRSAST